MFDPILDRFRNAVEKVGFITGQSGNHVLVSNLTGGFIEAQEAASPLYWTRHIRETVHFSAGIETLLARNKEILFVEVGAGRSLLGLLKQHSIDGKRPAGINLVRHQGEHGSDKAYLLEQVGKLWAQGGEIDWVSFNGNHTYKRISLPCYSFEQIKYPVEVNPGKMVSENSSTTTRQLKDWIYYPVWKSSFLFPVPAQEGKKCFLFFSKGDRLSDSLKHYLLKKDDVLAENTDRRPVPKKERAYFRVGSDDPISLQCAVSGVEA